MGIFFKKDLHMYTFISCSKGQLISKGNFGAFKSTINFDIFLEAKSLQKLGGCKFEDIQIPFRN